MRIVMLLPLALAAAAAGGCRTASEGTEQAALGVPQRDLTLQQAAAPEVEIASPVELARRDSFPVISRTVTPAVAIGTTNPRMPSSARRVTSSTRSMSCSGAEVVKLSV